MMEKFKSAIENVIDSEVIKTSKLTDLDKPLNLSEVNEKSSDISTSKILSELDNPLCKTYVENINENRNTNELSEDDKTRINEETGWSDTIVDSIRNIEEHNFVYKEAGLTEAVINDRPCLIKKIELDFETMDQRTGKTVTNRELMEKGKSPYDSKTGEKIELHHMGQDFVSPLAELCADSEHGGMNDKILHDKKAESWRRDPELRSKYNNHDKPNHWKSRI